MKIRSVAPLFILWILFFLVSCMETPSPGGDQVTFDTSEVAVLEIVTGTEGSLVGLTPEEALEHIFYPEDGALNVGHVIVNNGKTYTIKIKHSGGVLGARGLKVVEGGEIITQIPDTDGACGSLIKQGEECTIVFNVLQYGAPGEFDQDVTFVFNDGLKTSSFKLNLFGSAGLAGSIAIREDDGIFQNEVDFGFIAKGFSQSKRIHLTNDGDLPIKFGNPSTFQFDDQGVNFKYQGDRGFPGMGGTCDKGLDVNQSCSIVLLAETDTDSETPFQAQHYFGYNDGAGYVPVQLRLKAQGTDSLGLLDIVDNSLVEFGKVLNKSESDVGVGKVTWQLKNTGVQAVSSIELLNEENLPLLQVMSDEDDCSLLQDGALDVDETCNVSYLFRPTLSESAVEEWPVVIDDAIIQFSYFDGKRTLSTVKKIPVDASIVKEGHLVFFKDNDTDLRFDDDYDISSTTYSGQWKDNDLVSEIGARTPVTNNVYLANSHDFTRYPVSNISINFVPEVAGDNDSSISLSCGDLEGCEVTLDGGLSVENFPRESSFFKITYQPREDKVNGELETEATKSIVVSYDTGLKRKTFTLDVDVKASAVPLPEIFKQVFDEDLQDYVLEELGNELVTFPPRLQGMVQKTSLYIKNFAMSKLNLVENWNNMLLGDSSRYFDDLTVADYFYVPEDDLHVSGVYDLNQCNNVPIGRDLPGDDIEACEFSIHFKKNTFDPVAGVDTLTQKLTIRNGLEPLNPDRQERVINLSAQVLPPGSIAVDYDGLEGGSNPFDLGRVTMSDSSLTIEPIKRYPKFFEVKVISDSWPIRFGGKDPAVPAFRIEDNDSGAFSGLSLVGYDQDEKVFIFEYLYVAPEVPGMQTATLVIDWIGNDTCFLPDLLEDGSYSSDGVFSQPGTLQNPARVYLPSTPCAVPDDPNYVKVNTFRIPVRATAKEEPDMDFTSVTRDVFNGRTYEFGAVIPGTVIRKRIEVINTGQVSVGTGATHTLDAGTATEREGFLDGDKYVELSVNPREVNHPVLKDRDNNPIRHKTYTLDILTVDNPECAVEQVNEYTVRFDMGRLQKCYMDVIFSPVTSEDFPTPINSVYRDSDGSALSVTPYLELHGEGMKESKIDLLDTTTGTKEFVWLDKDPVFYTQSHTVMLRSSQDHEFPAEVTKIGLKPWSYCNSPYKETSPMDEEYRSEFKLGSSLSSAYGELVIDGVENGNFSLVKETSTCDISVSPSLSFELPYGKICSVDINFYPTLVQKIVRGCLEVQYNKMQGDISKRITKYVRLLGVGQLPPVIQNSWQEILAKGNTDGDTEGLTVDFSWRDMEVTPKEDGTIDASETRVAGYKVHRRRAYDARSQFFPLTTPDDPETPEDEEVIIRAKDPGRKSFGLDVFRYIDKTNSQQPPDRSATYQSEIDPAEDRLQSNLAFQYKVTPVITVEGNYEDDGVTLIEFDAGVPSSALLRVFVPPDDTVLVHRITANVLACTQFFGVLFDDLDTDKFSRCDYTGPGNIGNKFDIQNDWVVDRFENSKDQSNKVQNKPGSIKMFYSKSSAVEACSGKADYEGFGIPDLEVTNLKKRLLNRMEYMITSYGQKQSGCNGTEPTIRASGVNDCKSLFEAEDMIGNAWDILEEGMVVDPINNSWSVVSDGPLDGFEWTFPLEPLHIVEAETLYRPDTYGENTECVSQLTGMYYPSPVTNKCMDGMRLYNDFKGFMNIDDTKDYFIMLNDASQYFEQIQKTRSFFAGGSHNSISTSSSDAFNLHGMSMPISRWSLYLDNFDMVANYVRPATFDGGAVRCIYPVTYDVEK